MRLQLCLFLTVVLLFGKTYAEEGAFFPTDDSYVRRDEPFSNFGDGPTIRLRNNRFDSFLKFTVSSIESEIDHAKLVLTVAGTGEDGGTIYLVSNEYVDSSGPWTEEGINENNSPSIFGTPITSIGPIPTLNAKVEVDLSAVVTGNGTYSFAITSTSDSETKYYSKENIHTTDYNPVLLIDATLGNEPDDPVAVPDSKTTLEWTPIEIDVAANDTDPDGTVDPTTVNITVPSQHGTEVVSSETGVVTYTPDPGYVGMDVIKYTVKDNDGNTSNEGTVTITINEAQFTNITADAGIDNPATSWGATFNDFNNDGRLDLYVSTISESPNRLFVNNGDGTFSDLTSQYGVAASSRECLGVASADYDNDGYLDIVVATTSANILYRGGAGGFVDRSLDGISSSGAYSYAPAWGDYNKDGHVDLYMVNWNFTDEFYLNSGPANWSFSDITESIGVSGVPQSRSGAWADYDNDGDPDIFVAQGYSQSDEPDLLYNNDNGVFTDVSEDAGITGVLTSHAVAWGDYDNDGDLDLALATAVDQPNKLYRNDNGTFTDVSNAIGINNSDRCPSVAWLDHDNDGDLDLLFTRGNLGLASLFYENQGGLFVEKQNELGLGQDSGNNLGSSIGDYDNDGFLDIYLTNLEGGSTLFRNRGNSNNWVIFKLIGTASNTAAVGARVRIEAGGDSQIREVSGGSNSGSQHSLPVAFGLGTETVVDSVIINWPSGIVQRLAAVSIKQFVTIVEPAGCELEICEGPSLFPTDSSGVEGAPIESVTTDVVYVDIRVKQNPDIDAFGFVVNYDTTMLDFIDSENGSLTQGFDFFDVYDVGGRIVCGGANNDAPVPANSSGSLVRLIFTVECFQGQEAAISISDLADDVTGMSLCCNKIVCRNCRSDGDVNNSNSLSPGDALSAFQIFLFDQTLPPELNIPDFDCEMEAADVNCNGQVTPGDALEIFRAYLNEQPPQDCFAADPEPLARAGSENAPQLLLSNGMVHSNGDPANGEFRVLISGKQLASVDAFGFDLAYSVDKMKFIRLETIGITTDWSQLSAVETSAGGIRIGGYDADDEAQIAEGDLMMLVFRSSDAISANDIAVTELYDDFEFAEVSENFSPDNAIPDVFALHQNYPNPFNPETEIRFDIPRTAEEKVRVILAIYNLRGQLIRPLVDGSRAAGSHTAMWDGRDDAGTTMSTGTYFYRLEAGDFVNVKRMVLVR